MCSSCGIGVELVGLQWTFHRQLVTAAPAFAVGYSWLMATYIQCYVSFETVHSIGWPACEGEAGRAMWSLLKDAKQSIHVPGNEKVNRRLAKFEMSVLSVRANFTSRMLKGMP